MAPVSKYGREMFLHANGVLKCCTQSLVGDSGGCSEHQNTTEIQSINIDHEVLDRLRDSIKIELQAICALF